MPSVDDIDAAHEKLCECEAHFHTLDEEGEWQQSLRQTCLSRASNIAAQLGFESLNNDGFAVVYALSIAAASLLAIKVGFNNWLLAFVSSVIIFAGFVGIISICLSALGIPDEFAEYWEQVAERESEIDAASTECKLAESNFNYLVQWREKKIRLLAEKQEQHEELERQRTNRRYRLISVNFRNLRSIEFEEYVRDIFLELGYLVKTTARTCDDGVDLVVSAGGKQIAVQVKGYGGAVSNKAVQEVFTGRQCYSCNSALVITNSRFTKGAIDLAEKVKVQLIDGSMIRSLIDGRIVESLVVNKSLNDNESKADRLDAIEINDDDLGWHIDFVRKNDT